MSGRQSGKHNKCKTLRANSYLNKIKPPPCILTDVINLEINDLLVLKNFVSRNFSKTLPKMNFPLVLTVAVGVDSGAAQKDSRTLA